MKKLLVYLLVLPCFFLPLVSQAQFDQDNSGPFSSGNDPGQNSNTDLNKGSSLAPNQNSNNSDPSIVGPKDAGGDAGVPIDGGISLLLAAAAAAGIKTWRDNRKKAREKEGTII